MPECRMTTNANDKVPIARNRSNPIERLFKDGYLFMNVVSGFQIYQEVLIALSFTVSDLWVQGIVGICKKPQ